MIRWSIDCIIDWCIDCFIGGLVYWSIASFFIALLITPMIDLLTALLIYYLIYWLIYSLLPRLIDWSIDWLIDWLLDWLNDWISLKSIDWLYKVMIRPVYNSDAWSRTVGRGQGELQSSMTSTATASSTRRKSSPGCCLTSGWSRRTRRHTSSVLRDRRRQGRSARRRPRGDHRQARPLGWRQCGHGLRWLANVPRRTVADVRLVGGVCVASSDFSFEWSVDLQVNVGLFLSQVLMRVSWWSSESCFHICVSNNLIMMRLRGRKGLSSGRVNLLALVWPKLTVISSVGPLFL